MVRKKCVVTLALRAPFPDQSNEIIPIAHTGDTVLVEFRLGSDKIICEWPYFDQTAVVRALG